MGQDKIKRYALLALVGCALTLSGCSSQGGSSLTTRAASVLCLGDSQTYSTGYGLTADQYWPRQTQALATKDGYAATMGNEGHSDWTTSDLLGVLPADLQKYAPNILIFYAGVNDKGHGLTSATTQSNIQTVIDSAMSAGVSYVLIVNTNFLNYSSRGDNALTGKYYDNYQTLRTYQLAATNYGITKYGASKVGYCDLFTYQKNLILAGTWTQGQWQDSQVADMNEHMNPAAQLATATYIWSLLKAVPNLMAPFKP